VAKPRSRKHQDQTGDSATQMPMFVPESDWRPPRVGDLPEWPKNASARVAIDVETKDPDIKKMGCGARRDDTMLVGYSFRIEGGPGFYVPMRHQGGDNVENPDAALAYLAAQARLFKGQLVGCNLGYDCDWMAQEGVDFIDSPCTWRDIGVAEPLLDELQFNYGLEAISGRYGREGKDESLLKAAAEHFDVHPKAGLWKLPARFVGPYGLGDVDEPLALLRLQETRIEEAGLWDIFNLECSVQPILTLMRRRGVLIDQDRLDQVEQWARGEEQAALDEIHRLTGVKIGTAKGKGIMAPSQVAPALEAIGVTLKKTSKGQAEIKQETLAGIDHPVAERILWARKTNKLRTTFVASVREHMVNGRIHATFNQLRRNDSDSEAAQDDGSGARYGRLSSEKPNLQQQPARDEFAKMWRAIYLPEEGMQWGSLDYSQQEPRMLMHYAENCPVGDLRKGKGISQHARNAAVAAAEQYRRDRNTDNHTMVARMAGIDRKPAKEIFLGKIYGLGGAKLCRKLGLSTAWVVYGKKWADTQYFDIQDRQSAQLYANECGGRLMEGAGEEGRALLATFDEKLPFVKELARFAKAKADERGYVITILGRHCHFPVGKDGKYDWTQKSLNRVIQGSAADQTKKALVDVHNAGHYLQLQVHDELTGSFHGAGDAQDAAEIMEHCIPQLTVPSKVDVELGSSWGDSM